LIPSLHQKTDIKTSLHQIGFILAGVVLILVMQGIAHQFEAKMDVIENIDRANVV